MKEVELAPADAGKSIGERLFGTARFDRAEWWLFLSLMVMAFIPGLNDLFITRLASGEEIIDIIGQIEWFDTINEMVLAFLVLPLYNLLNSVKGDRTLFQNRISLVVSFGLAIYLVFSLFVVIYASSLAEGMGAPSESVSYLRLMSVGFVFDYLVQVFMVILVVIGRVLYVNMLIIAKVTMLIIFDIIFMNGYSYMGVAYSTIVANMSMILVCLLSLKHENLLPRRPELDRQTFGQWARVGGFSGGQIFLDNFIYIVMVCVMVNAVSESGNYWVANSFIWGWLLVPISALSEIVRRDYSRGISRMRTYFAVVSIIIVIWLLTMPGWGFLISDVFMADEPQVVLTIVCSLVPFYLAYMVAAILDSVFLSLGKTEYLFAISVFVNIVYYGIVYLLFSAGMVHASLDFIVLMFGFGMVVHMVLSVLFYLRYRGNVEVREVVSS